jgi:hypothetical protein
MLGLEMNMLEVFPIYPLVILVEKLRFFLLGLKQRGVKMYLVFKKKPFHRRFDPLPERRYYSLSSSEHVPLIIKAGDKWLQTTGRRFARGWMFVAVGDEFFNIPIQKCFSASRKNLCIIYMLNSFHKDTATFQQLQDAINIEANLSPFYKQSQRPWIELYLASKKAKELHVAKTFANQDFVNYEKGDLVTYRG